MSELLLLVALVVAQPRCADFSGRYVITGEDGTVDVRIAQTRCERLTISWESSMAPRPPVTHTVTLDGVLRDAHSWFNNERTRTAGTINQSILDFRFIYRPNEPTSAIEATLRLELLDSGDVCVTDDSTGRNQHPMLARRVGAGGPMPSGLPLRSAREACG